MRSLHGFLKTDTTNFIVDSVTDNIKHNSANIDFQGYSKRVSLKKEFIKSLL